MTPAIAPCLLALSLAENPTSAGASGSTGWIVHETSLGAVGDHLVVSPDRRHVARVARRADRQIVLHDRAASPGYEEVKGLYPDRLLFSPDSQRLAYLARREGVPRLVVDGREVATVPECCGSIWTQESTVRVFFTLGGNRWFAWVVEGLAQGVRFFFEGQDQPLDPVPNSLCVSRDGTRFAVMNWANQRLLTVYGPEGISRREAGPQRTAKYLYPCPLGPGPECEFSPDGRKLAYAVVLKNVHAVEKFFGADASCRLMVDEVPMGDGEELKWPVFSPDGTRLSFPVKRSGKWQVVVDGREEGPYDSVADGLDALGMTVQLFFSPDGRRFGYGARTGDRWSIVIDGTSGPPYERVSPPVFSPDGRRVAHRAKRQGKWLVVVDGEPGRPYDGIEEQALGERGWPRDELLFSPDGAHLAYRARRTGHWFVVLDGQEGPAYDELASLAFSTDGSHIAYAARRKGRWSLVVDGVEGPEYDFLTDRRVVFDGPRQFHTVIRRSTEYLLLEVEVAGGSTSAPPRQ